MVRKIGRKIGFCKIYLQHRIGYHLPTCILWLNYLPTYLFASKKIILIIILKRYYLNNLTSQMVHCSLVKMTGQMVFTLLVRNTTPITLDMLKSICPKWKGSFLAPIQIWCFLQNFPIWKIKNFSNDAIIYKNGQYYEVCISIKHDINVEISFSFFEVDVKKESIKNIKPFIPSSKILFQTIDGFQQFANHVGLIGRC